MGDTSNNLAENLRTIADTLANHPDAERGNSTVHYALHKARSALADIQSGEVLIVDRERMVNGFADAARDVMNGANKIRTARGDKSEWGIAAMFSAYLD